MIVDSPVPISGQALLAAGVTGILRYIAKEGGSSVVVGVTAGEVADLQANGVDLALIYEERSATWMSGGASAGAEAANWVQSQLNAIGQPDAPVYFAADSNTLNANAVNACLDSIAAVIGFERTGAYAYAPQLTSSFTGNHAQRFWLTGSSSGIQSWMNLYQKNNETTTIAGQSVDIDVPLQDDWGQIGADVPLTQADAVLVAQTVWAQILSSIDGKNTKLSAATWLVGADQGAWAADVDAQAATKAAQQGDADLKAAAAQLNATLQTLPTGDPKAVAAALAPALAPAVTAADVPAFLTALKEQLEK